VELERGERVGAPGGGLEREGEGERVEEGSRRPARRRRQRAGCGEAARPRSAALRSLVAGLGSERRRRSAWGSAAACGESARRSRKRARRGGWEPRRPEVRRRAWNCSWWESVARRGRRDSSCCSTAAAAVDGGGGGMGRARTGWAWDSARQ